MCGITGFLSRSPSPDRLDLVAERMARAIAHRGPDDAGAWCDAGAGVALGHRRLAIVDLSPHGHQPMVSADGRYVMVYNGEIYNFTELRRELGGYPFRGHSDTEVMLAAFGRWGVRATLERLVGMFAFAVWDREGRTLTLARDRLGEKPLYYGWQGQAFLFGSELKALRAHPSWQPEINRDALTLYMRYSCIPAPFSVYRGIFKLPPGALLELPEALRPGVLPEPQVYWSARAVAEAGAADPFTGTDAEAADALDALLRRVIRGQMVADVPLGAFLSGGVDSSAVVALMQAQSDVPVKTFTIGFNEDEYNEAHHAKAVAKHLGTDHTELYVTPDAALAVIPRLATLYDEPFADASQVPTFLVAELARRHVTVSLSGDGGDELFGGYNRHFWGRDLWRRLGPVPPGFRRLAARGMTAWSPQRWDEVFERVRPLLPGALKEEASGSKVHKLADVLAVSSPEEMYSRFRSRWLTPAQVVLNAAEPRNLLNDESQWAKLDDFTQRMMFLDLVSYLPDDNLVKLDRASMGVSLESRVPFLDHRVVAFAWKLPLELKIRDGQGKWILRQVLYRYVPEALIERPKVGFGVPIDSWLRGPLREWAEALLDEDRLRREGFFDPRPIRMMWEEHLSGRKNQQNPLWNVLMFQAWLEAAKRVDSGYQTA
jgi:asparagine synthase (glutamine-hydrolysing)